MNDDSIQNSTEFEDYNQTSEIYDITRIPVGIEIIIGVLANNNLPLNQQVLLDTGCGTGNYIMVLKQFISMITGIEINQNMLKQARLKFQNDPSVEIDEGNIINLPYKNESFDGIICNHVIHHLDQETYFKGEVSIEDYPNFIKFIREAFRVLRPNGALLINTCSHQQQRNGYWWAELIPNAIERVIRKFPPITLIEEVLCKNNFHEIKIFVPLHSVLQGLNYLDPEGPLKSEWRAGDSTWSLATTKELTQALNCVREMNQNGTIHLYLESRERLRRKIGQTTFICARKL
ncbi:MAG: class I SAM-dependent methyltransferase [Promethearchaeota archaeon]